MEEGHKPSVFWADLKQTLSHFTEWHKKNHKKFHTGELAFHLISKTGTSQAHARSFIA
jgi:hypothetical protein